MAETTTTSVQPATFIEAESKLYLDQLKNAIGGVKGLDLSKIMGPQFVAGMDPLTQQAIGQASGLGSYAPFLQAAGAATGPTAYQAYMSPYQQDVIGTTLQEYDIQAQKGLPQLAQQAISAGAFGGGREGVQRAEYQSASDRNRAALQAQLLQQGFGQAQQLAQQAYWSTNEISTSCSTISWSTDCRFNYIRWFRSISITSSTFCTTTTCTTTSISTFINCTAIWFRNHGSNIRIPWKNRNRSISITYSIPKYIRCRCNTCWNI
jgi:hypothetical protein